MSGLLVGPIRRRRLRPLPVRARALGMSAMIVAGIALTACQPSAVPAQSSLSTPSSSPDGSTPPSPTVTSAAAQVAGAANGRDPVRQSVLAGSTTLTSTKDGGTVAVAMRLDPTPRHEDVCGQGAPRTSPTTSH